jgi:hypothetical protein
MKNSSRTLNGVDSLVTCAASLISPLKAPIKVCTTHLRGLGGSVHRQVVAADMPHYQHHPHLLRCWQKNLGLKDVKWKTVIKVGVDPLHPPCLQTCNISPHNCLNPLRFLVFDSETADDTVSHAKPHVALRKTVVQQHSTERSRNFCKTLG